MDLFSANFFFKKEESNGNKIGIGIPNFIFIFGANGMYKKGGVKAELKGFKGVADKFEPPLLFFIFLVVEFILLSL